MNGLTPLERHRDAINPDDLVLQTYDVHFNSSQARIVKGAVLELLDSEISGQLSIESHQQIQIESRGYTVVIVVRPLKDTRILFQIDAEKQSSAGSA